VKIGPAKKYGRSGEDLGIPRWKRGPPTIKARLDWALAPVDFWQPNRFAPSALENLRRVKLRIGRRCAPFFFAGLKPRASTNDLSDPRSRSTTSVATVKVRDARSKYE
jgi:hypothetical protein